jgi:hypothetical protein
MAVSASLVREEDEMQKPVYFVSKALHGAGKKASPDREAGIRPHSGFKETPTLLSCSHHLSPHRIPTPKSNTETGSVKTIGKLGHRTRAI